MLIFFLSDVCFSMSKNVHYIFSSLRMFCLQYQYQCLMPGFQLQNNP